MGTSSTKFKRVVQKMRGKEARPGMGGKTSSAQTQTKRGSEEGIKNHKFATQKSRTDTLSRGADAPDRPTPEQMQDAITASIRAVEPFPRGQLAPEPPGFKPEP